MIYKYRVNIYETSIKFIIIIAGLPAIFLIINGYKTAGIVTAIITIGMVMVLKLASYHNKKYSFIVMGNSLKIMQGKNEFHLPWSEIKGIDEITFGIVIKLYIDDQNFTIFDDLDDYERFKTEVFCKAGEYGIPICNELEDENEH